MQPEISNNELKIIPLGGVEEIGINCTVYQYKDQILVVDVGAGFPEADMYGIDFIVPNVDYLVKNKDKIQGIVITHGHLDHIGGLPYLLPRLGFPKLYGTAFTLEMIKAKLEEHKILGQTRLNVIDPESVVRAGEIEAKFFSVNHSIPQCVGVVVSTPAGRAVHTGDFKFDNSPVNEPVADYARIAQIGQSGVDILLSDSTNSLRKGHPISESEVADKLEEVIDHAKGRVVIAAFSGLVGRLYQLIKIAEKQDRKVAIAGYSMNQTLRIAQEIGYIHPKPGLIVPIQKINRYNDNRVMILTTGAQGESNAALFRMANEEYKNVQLKKGDTVIISAGTIPGNNLAVQYLIDAVTARGAVVYQSEDMDLYTSGHGYQEDQKIMLNLVKPKFFMPVHGYQYFLREHGRTAMQVGVKEQNVIIAKRGSVISGSRQAGFRVESQIKAIPLLVSGSGVGDIGSVVLTERQQLGNYGVVVLMINLTRNKWRLVGDTQVHTRGFVFVKTSQDLIAEIGKVATKAVTKDAKAQDLTELRSYITEEVSKFVNKQTGRNPAILPVINFIAENPGANNQRRDFKKHKGQHRPRPENLQVAEQIPVNPVSNPLS